MSKSSLSHVIIGGDWNVTLQAIDKQGGIQWKPTAYCYQITAMMEELDLIDVFRKKYPDKKIFTYESIARKIKFRIDFFLVSKSIASQVVEVGTKTSIAPDHKAVKLRFNLINSKRGPGLWKFNNSLLKDETYVNLIQDSYPDIIQKYSNINDSKLKWELIKMEIRGLTIPYSKNKASKMRKTEDELEKRLELLNGKFDQGEDTTESERKEYEHLKTELRHIYENLYNSSNNSTNEDFHEFTNNINQQLPKLSTEQCNGIEGKLTLNECWEALKSMGTGRSPGEDGFTAEFYKCFFEIVGKDLLNSYNAVYENGTTRYSRYTSFIGFQESI